MRFMLLLYPEVRTETGAPADGAAQARRKYHQELIRSGVLLALDNLTPAGSGGVRIHQRGAERTTCEGPFPEVTASVGGYWLIAVRSQAEALAWAARCPLADGDMLELRQVDDAALPPREA